MPHASVVPARRLIGVVVGMVVVVALGACSGGSTNDPHGAGGGGDGQLTREDLLARPALEDVVDTYDAMLTEMRDALSEDFAGTWTEADPAGGGPSGDTVDGVEASFASSITWLLDTSVSGSTADKQRALDAITPIAQRYGFGEPEVFLDREGEIQVVAEDDMGASLRFGSVDATTLTYSTGTHFTRDEQAGAKDKS